MRAPYKKVKGRKRAPPRPSGRELRPLPGVFLEKTAGFVIGRKGSGGSGYLSRHLNASATVLAVAFSKSEIYLRPACTPRQIAKALATAFDKANGASRLFSLQSLGFSTKDDVQFVDTDATVADIAALAEIPEQLEIRARDEGGGVHSVLVSFRRSVVQLTLMASASDALLRFFDSFTTDLALVEEHSTPSLEPTPSQVGAQKSGTSKVKDHKGPAPLLIFTALQEERKILEEALGLKTTYEDGVARGVRHGSPIELISSKKMGRVPAAVAIATHLARSPVRFRLIVAAGLAGGFTESNTQRGAVVIASEIVDLATRKEHETRTEFRPAVFQLDDTLGRYIRSSAFDREKWEKSVLARDDWPQHLRPHIIEGVLACTDEIVSSDAWRSELVQAWAKLLGIEMESGGACAAAEAFGMKITVIRGVSDLADPRKSDDLWRRLAMRAVAETLDALIASGLLLAPPG